VKPAIPQRLRGGGAVKPSAFTIVELLVASAVLIIILGVIFSITQQTSAAWKSASSKIETFQRARAAFEAITQTLGEATLFNYYDYDSFEKPKRYYRKSDLHFISGKSLVPAQLTHAVFFQTPTGYSDSANYQGLEALLNACGFFITYSVDDSRPDFLASLPNKPKDKYRFRLMEFLQPSQNLAVYADSSGTDWFTVALASSAPPVRQIADNVIALVLIPRTSQGVELTSDYEYDSRSWTPGTAGLQPATSNQLPPLVEVVMVAIDEPSAARWCTGPSAPPLVSDTLFRRPSSLEIDLDTLAGSLTEKRITYRIFRTTVALRNAKWSS